MSPIQNVHYEIQQRLYNAWQLWIAVTGTARIRANARVHLTWWPINHPGSVTDQPIKIPTKIDILYVHVTKGVKNVTDYSLLGCRQTLTVPSALAVTISPASVGWCSVQVMILS